MNIEEEGKEEISERLTTQCHRYVHVKYVYVETWLTWMQ